MRKYLLLVPALLLLSPAYNYASPGSDRDLITAVIRRMRAEYGEPKAIHYARAANGALAGLKDRWVLLPFDSAEAQKFEEVLGTVLEKRTPAGKDLRLVRLSEPVYPPRKPTDRWKSLTDSERRAEAKRLADLQSALEDSLAEHWKTVDFERSDLDTLIRGASEMCKNQGEQCRGDLMFRAASAMIMSYDSHGRLLRKVPWSELDSRGKNEQKRALPYSYVFRAGRLIVGHPVFGYTPAKEELKEGDVLLLLNKKAVPTEEKEAVRMLLTEENSLELVVFRADTLEFPVYRIPTIARSQPTLAMERIRNSSIISIKLESFYDPDGSTARAVEQQYEKLASQFEPSGIIIDLRGNKGGPMQDVQAVTELFLNAGIEYAAMAYSPPDFKYHRKLESKSPNPIAQKIPIIVLIGQSTASGAELMAGALRNHRGSLLLGSSTFGLGRVSKIQEFEASGGPYLLKTTAAELEVDGQRITDSPLTPDLWLENGKLIIGTGDLPETVDTNHDVSLGTINEYRIKLLKKIRLAPDLTVPPESKDPELDLAIAILRVLAPR